jgi:AcrR family transcriptional regulator
MAKARAPEAARPAPIEIVETRSVGAARLVEALWARLGLPAALRAANETSGRLTSDLQDELLRLVSGLLGVPAPKAVDAPPPGRALDALRRIPAPDLEAIHNVLLARVADVLELPIEPHFVVDGRGMPAAVVVTPDGLPVRVVTEGSAPPETFRVAPVVPTGEERSSMHRARQRLIATERIRGGGELAQKALSRQGRYRDLTDRLRAKELRLDEGPGRWLLLHDITEGRSDARARGGSPPEERLDGKFLVWTAVDDGAVEVLVAGAQAALRTAQTLADLTGHQLPDPDDPAGLLLLWMALVVARAAEEASGMPWTGIREDFERLNEVVFKSGGALIVQMASPTPAQQQLLDQLGIPPAALAGDQGSGAEPVEPAALPGWTALLSEIAESPNGALRLSDAALTSGQTRPHKRRAPGEGRILLLRAAREVFSEMGYTRASTRVIAERAGIAEALLFRNFGSKAALFEEAALSLFQEFVDDWGRAHRSSPALGSEEDIALELIGRFYDLVRANRGLFLSYIATSVFEPSVVSIEKAPVFLEAIDTLAHWSATKFLAPRGLSSHNVRIANRAVVGMILSMALFDDWLAPADGEPPNRDDIVEEMTQILLYGVTRASLRLAEG